MATTALAVTRHRPAHEFTVSRQPRRGVLGNLRLLTITAIAVAGLSVTPSSSAAGPFTAKISNPTNTVGSATYFTCSNAAIGDAAFLAYPLNDTTGTTASDISGNNRTGAYQGTVTRTASKACNRDTSGSALFNGSSNYVSTPTSITGPGVFTIEVWFNTTTTTGGKLIGFGNLATGTSSSYDRHLYLTNTGQLVFGVYPNAVKTITSPGSYNNGAWHHAAATLSAAGMVLYVDGANVATDPATTTAQAYTGFWRFGYDNLSGWTSQPSSAYYAGNLAYAAVYSTALTATQIKNHYIAGR